MNTGDEAPARRPFKRTTLYRQYIPAPVTYAPDYRRGAMKTAIELQREELHGALEPRPDRGAPVEATGVDELLGKLAEKSLRTLEEDLADPEPRARQEAARTIVQAWSKVKAEADAKAALTDEEREAQLEAALSSPKLVAFLEARGWRKAGP